MSMLLTFLMVFTTVMPYTAFAEDSVLTDGAGDMELVGVSSGANGTEAEIVDASGDGESSLITDQADASSASGAQDSDSSAASGAGSDGSADASLDGLFEDEPDAASTDAAASEDTGAANTYLNEDTRTVYLVNRNSYADLQLWNENKTGDEADFWVQHVEKADNEHPYTLFGSDDKSGSAAAGSSSDASTVAASAATASAPADAIPASGNDNTSGAAAASSASGTTAADTSYRFEEVKMTNTGYKDSKGGDIYTAQIPESWDYVTFAYFADDSDLTEATRIDEAGYPQGVAANGRHRTMVIKVSDKKNYIVGVPLTKDEATLAGLSAGDMIWKALEIEKQGTQAFYVNAEHFEDANGNIYRKPMAERLDAAETETTETTAETEKVTEATESDIQNTEAGTESDSENIAGNGIEDSTEAETESDSENTVETGETAEETENSDDGIVVPIVGPRKLSGFTGPRKAAAANGGKIIYFKTQGALEGSGNNTTWWNDPVYIYAWGDGNNGTVSMTLETADYETTDGTKLYYYEVPSGYTSFMFKALSAGSQNEWDISNRTVNVTSFEDGDCFYLTKNSTSDTTTIVQNDNFGHNISKVNLKKETLNGVQAKATDNLTIDLASSTVKPGSSTTATLTAGSTITSGNPTFTWSAVDASGSAITGVTVSQTTTNDATTPVTISVDSSVADGTEVTVKVSASYTKDGSSASKEATATLKVQKAQMLYYLAPSTWNTCYAYFAKNNTAVSNPAFTGMDYISDTSNYTVDGTAFSSSDVNGMHLFSVEVPDGASQVIFVRDGNWTSKAQDPTATNMFLNTTIAGSHNSNTDNSYTYENDKLSTNSGRATHYIALAHEVWLAPSTINMKYAAGETNAADLTIKKSSTLGDITNVVWTVGNSSTTEGSFVKITSSDNSGATVQSKAVGGQETVTAKVTIGEEEYTATANVTVTAKNYVYYHASADWSSCYAYFVKKENNTYSHVDTDADDTTDNIRRLAMEQLDWEKYSEDNAAMTSGNLFRVEIPEGATDVIFTDHTGSWKGSTGKANEGHQDPTTDNKYFTLSSINGTTGQNGFAYDSTSHTDAGSRTHNYALRTGVWINPANTDIQFVQDEQNGTSLVLVKGSDVTGTITRVEWHVDADNDGTYDEAEDRAVADVTSGSGNVTVASLNAHAAGTVKVKATVTVKDNVTENTATLNADDVEIRITERKRIYFLAPSDTWTSAYAIFAPVDKNPTAKPVANTNLGNSTNGWVKMDTVDTSQMAMDGGAIPEGYTLFSTLAPTFTNPTTSEAQTAYVIFSTDAKWKSGGATAQDPSANDVWFTTAFDKSTATAPIDLTSKYNNGYMYDETNTSAAGTNYVSGRTQRYFGPRQGIWITPQTTALDYAQGETHTATLTLNKGSNVGDITSITWTSNTPGVAVVKSNVSGAADVTNGSKAEPEDGKLVDDLTATVTSKSGGTAIITATVTAKQSDGTTTTFETTFDTSADADQLKNTGAKVDVTAHNYIYYLADPSWTDCYAYFMDKDGNQFSLPTDYQNAHKDAIDSTGGVTRVKMDALTTSDYFEDNAGIESGNLFRIEVPDGAKQVIFTSHAGNWDGSDNNKNEGKQDPTGQGAAFSLDLTGTAKDKAKGTNLTDADGKPLKNNGYQYDSDHSSGSRTEHYFGAPQGTYLDPSTVTLRKSDNVSEEKELKLHTELTYGTDYDKVVWTTTDADGTYVKIIEKNDESATVKAVSKTGTKGPVTITATLYRGSTAVDTAVAKVTVSDKLVIYYDAAFSKLAYKAGDGKADSAIPKNDRIINYTIKFVDNNNATQTVTGTMTKVPTSDVPSSAKGSWADIYKTAELDNVKTITSVVFKNTTGFATKESVNTDTTTTDYEKIKYDATLTNPCFYADTGDNINYIKSGNRGGYWGELWETRDKSSSVLGSANKSSDQTDRKPVVGTDKVTNIVAGTYPGNTTDGRTIYVNSSFYDYLSDYELNGLSRGNYPGNNGVSQRNWVTFREFDQALSGYYSASHTAYPMYTGHFQPPVSGWGTQFQEIGYTMGLYGYTAGNIPGDKFYTVNNSSTDSSGNAGFYNYATQGLFNIAQSTYFNTDFLSGNNNKHAKLANIYPSVKFPMTKTNENVMHKTGSDTKSVEYYVFDSAETTLHLAGTTGQKYLAETADRSWSTNVTSGGTAGSDKNQSVSNTYGFFPLDDTTGSNGKLGTGVDHNYGFGAKITIPFTVSSDGMTTASDGTKVPQIFKFSGDDDIWIFIDGDLALDLGGDHGRVYGAINFAKTNASSNYTRVDFKDNGGKTIWKNVQNAHNYVSYVKTVNGLSSYAVDQSNDVSDILNGHNVYDGKTHYMTIYYMERGQWESNMRMEMSLKPVVSVDVTKKFTDSSGTDITTQITSGRVFAMVTRKYKTGTDSSNNPTYSEPEIYPVNSSARTTAEKYCLELSKENGWTNSLTQLQQYHNDNQSEPYVYTVTEALMNNGQLAVSTTKDSAGVYYPIEAKTGDTVTVDGKTFIVQPGTSTGDNVNTSYTLTNKQTTPTSVKVQKRFVDTTAATRPNGIKIKLQRAVVKLVNDDGTSKNLTEDQIKTAAAALISSSGTIWSDVTVDGQKDDRWFVLDDTDSSTSGDVTTWSHTFKGLARDEITGSVVTGRYVYRVVEASSLSKTQTNNDGSTSTVAPDRAADSSTVTYGSNSYIVYYGGTDNDGKANWVIAPKAPTSGSTDTTQPTVTLTNKRQHKVDLEVKKIFTGTDDDSSTRPDSIRFKVQRAIIANYDSKTNQLTVPDNMSENKENKRQNDWKDLTAADLNETASTLPADVSGWFIWTPSTNSTTWTKVFSGLPIQPTDENAQPGEYYVYRVIEATNATNPAEAENGQSVTYANGEKNNSYWVRYSNGTYTNAYLPVTVTRSGAAGSYSYDVTVNKKGEGSSATEGGTAVMVNTLIVHLPSTGSRTGLTLTILSLICLAAAGSFGIFGRKRRLIA